MGGGGGGGGGFRAPPLAVAVGCGGAFCWWVGAEASAARVRARGANAAANLPGGASLEGRPELISCSRAHAGPQAYARPQAYACAPSLRWAPSPCRCASLCQVSPTDPKPNPHQVSPTENNKIGMVVRAGGHGHTITTPSPHHRHRHHTITTPSLHHYTITTPLHHHYTTTTPPLHHNTITAQVLRGNSIPTPTPTPTPTPDQVVRGNSIVMMEALEKLWTEARPVAY